MLGETVQFYTSCFRALPNRGSRFYFPDPAYEDDTERLYFQERGAASAARAGGAIASGSASRSWRPTWR